MVMELKCQCNKVGAENEYRVRDKRAQQDDARIPKLDRQQAQWNGMDGAMTDGATE